MSNDQLFRDLAAATARSVRPAALKLSYIGPQRKPIPSVLVSTYHRLPSLADFAPFQGPHLHYGNDALTLLHFTVADAVMARVQAGIWNQAQRVHGAAGVPVLAVVVHLADDGSGAAAGVGGSGAELLLAADLAVEFTATLTAALDRGDITGREVMTIFSQAAFATSGTVGGVP